MADGINFTYDWGGFGPICGEITGCLSEAPGFERILLSPKQGPFLIQTGFEASTSCIGDGAPATVTGSAITHSTLGLQNFFRVEGPPGSNLDNAGNDFITTNLFTVFGHRFGSLETCEAAPPPPVVTTDVVTITRARLRNSNLEVRATSSNGLPMTAEALSAAGFVVGSGNLVNGRVTFATTGTPTTVRVHSTSNDPLILDGVAIAPVTN